MEMENSDKPRARIEHYRAGLFGGVDRYQRGRGFLADVQRDNKDLRVKPQECGGWTRAVVTFDTLPELRASIKYVRAFENSVTAVAVCSAKDSFCYEIGRDIAVGRLRKQLQLWGLEDAVAWP